MADKLANYIVDTPIYTKVDDIRKKTIDMPREKLIERIQATTTELVKLQYTMREYSILEWFDSLNDRQKALHMFFEQHAERFKKESNDKNWLVLSDHDFEVVENITIKGRFDDNTDIWYGFIDNASDVEAISEEYYEMKLDGMLYTPLFSISK